MAGMSSLLPSSDKKLRQEQIPTWSVQPRVLGPAPSIRPIGRSGPQLEGKSEKLLASQNWPSTWGSLRGLPEGLPAGCANRGQLPRNAASSGGTKLCSSVASASVSATSMSTTSTGSR